MRRYRDAILVAAVGVMATKYTEILRFGPPTARDLPALDAVSKASIDPTTTRSVAFKPFATYQDQLENGSVLRDAEWTWRVNISDIAVPDADLTGREETQDPHVASTVFDFSWPGGGNISDAFDGANGSLCLSVAFNYDFSVDVLNKYTDESDDSVDCRPFLGDECMDALRKDAVTRSQNGQCQPNAFNLTASPACVESLGILATDTYPGEFPSEWPQARGFSLPLNGTAYGNDSALPEWTSGAPFFTHSFPPLSGPRNRTFVVQANTLHIVMLNPQLDGREGSVGGPQLMCMRLNATKLPHEDPNDDGVARLRENWDVAESRGGRLGAWPCALAALLSALAVLVASVG